MTRWTRGSPLRRSASTSSAETAATTVGASRFLCPCSHHSRAGLTRLASRSFRAAHLYPLSAHMCKTAMAVTKSLLGAKQPGLDPLASHTQYFLWRSTQTHPSSIARSHGSPSRSHPSSCPLRSRRTSLCHLHQLLKGITRLSLAPSLPYNPLYLQPPPDEMRTSSRTISGRVFPRMPDLQGILFWTSLRTKAQVRMTRSHP